jgi:hypothetical protein
VKKRGITYFTRLYTTLLYFTLLYYLQVERKMKKRGITKMLVSMLYSTLLYFTLLYYLQVERKMKKRGITKMLVSMLKRRSPELLLLACAFLKKLSIFKENKDEMNECNIHAELLGKP